QSRSLLPTLSSSHTYSRYFLSFFSMIPPPPRSTLFPYTTLFRSESDLHDLLPVDAVAADGLAHAEIAEDRMGRARGRHRLPVLGDRKSTRLNSSHLGISYAVFCLKKKKKIKQLESDDCNRIN